MGGASGSIRIAAALLGALVLLGAPEAVRAAGPEPAAWYVDVGGGAGWSATMDKAGHNRDTTCSPNRDCGGRHVEGFRWFQDLVPETGHTFCDRGGPTDRAAAV